MLAYVNISIAVTVFMGLASGGLLTLVLMAHRKQQVSFSIMFALSGLLAVMGAIGSAALIQSTSAGLLNGVVLLVLAFTLGYTLTTYSVLSRSTRKIRVKPLTVPPECTAIICLAPGEPGEKVACVREYQHRGDRLYGPGERRPPDAGPDGAP